MLVAAKGNLGKTYVCVCGAELLQPLLYSTLTIPRHLLLPFDLKLDHNYDAQCINMETTVYATTCMEH